MLINTNDISKYNCKCVRFNVSTSEYTYNDLSMHNFKHGDTSNQSSENHRTADSIFIFKGTKNTIQKNISKFIEDIKVSTIESCGFLYNVVIETGTYIDVFTNNSVKLPLKLTVLDVYEAEKSITKNTNFTLDINSPKPCYANLELTSTTNVISYTVKVNDTEIVVKNIKGNETVYIGSGKVIAGGISKINDVDLWEFPQLKPGTNKIEVNRADVTLKIKYNERW